MGMNPHTNEFEPLDSPAAVERAHNEGWKTFKIGEKVTIKDIAFGVQDISPNKLVLRPYGGASVVESGAVAATAVNSESCGIGWAVKQLQHGSRVCRAGWNGKGMYLILVPGSVFKVNRKPLIDVLPEGTDVNYRPHVDICSADGAFVPWNASQSDLLAIDWEIAT